jgi:GNAT superfamily N-acetyltransferase/SAM-dependent methyltransferase
VPVARVDYEQHGAAYPRHRRSDPRIAARIHAALGTARTVINVGAGTGSYEPTDRWVLAVEPSAAMRAGRAPGAAPAIDARAEALPLDDGAVDAAMACITVHHWEPPEAGLAELRRVARGPIVVLTFDLDALAPWQQEFLAEGLQIERPRFGPVGRVAAALGGQTRTETIPTPADCRDGFFDAYWNRPEALLDPSVRASQSMWALLPPGVEDRIVARLSAALQTGAWDAEHGHLRHLDAYQGALRLVISEPQTTVKREPLAELSVGDESFQVRRAVSEDVPQIVTLLASDDIGIARDGGNLALYEHAFEAIDADPGQLLAVMTDRQGTVVGTLQLSFISGLARHGALRAQIEAVRVHENLRGRGAGRALLEWAIGEAERRGCALVQLTSDKRRGEAHRFYDQLGFEASHEGFKLQLSTD